jgi:hypothetical protein
MSVTLEPLYTATFTTPESWSVQLSGVNGNEAQSFLIAEGTTEGRIAARLRAANAPRRRADAVLTPDFRGVLETTDGATIYFEWDGLTRPASDGPRRLVGGIKHLTDDARYDWLNTTYGLVAGEVRERPGGSGFDVVLEISAVS